MLASKLSEKRLNKHGFGQSKLVPGLRKHDTQPIQFTLVVDDFGVKYTHKKDVHVEGMADTCPSPCPNITHKHTILSP